MANTRNTSTTSEKAEFLKSLKPVEPSINTYLGHPWTKDYDEIVPKYDLKSPTIDNLNYYADNFGLDTSVTNLKNKFDALTKQEYAQKNAEYAASENQYYKDMIQQNAQYQDAIQQASSEALKAGASRGMQYANQFAAQNILAEQNATGALDLATQRNNLKAQEAEAYTKNAIEAEDTIRNLKLNILGQAVADRANSIQGYAADTQMAATDATLRINNYQANIAKEYERMFKDKEINAQEYIELMKDLSSMRGQDLDYLATLRGQDINLASSRYNANSYRSGYGGYSGYNKYRGSSKQSTSNNEYATIDDVTAEIDRLANSKNYYNQEQLNMLLANYAPYLANNSKYSHMYDKNGNPNYKITNPDYEAYLKSLNDKNKKKTTTTKDTNNSKTSTTLGPKQGRGV